ncbi:MAG: glycosyltransferase family 4 protein [Muribaculaceae bacterium]|nr:glycosyltransferase family 4 protein [Muribaculaceae bacterium]
MRNTTGLGNYSRYALEVMARGLPHDKLYMCHGAVRVHERLRPLEKYHNLRHLTPEGLWKHFPALWRQWGVVGSLRAAGVNLYHGLSNEIPSGLDSAGIASVVTVHDLIYRRCPEDYAAVDRAMYNLKYAASARHATRVIAISECTKRDIISDFGVPEDRIDVIYQGTDTIFDHIPDGGYTARVLHGHGLTEPYVLAVGTVQPRKNQLMALNAMHELWERGCSHKLVLVGKLAGAYGRKVLDYIRRNRLENRVMCRDDISFRDLPALYAGADVTLYVSRYEGFGLPVAESLRMLTPVVACSGSCLEEAGGPGAIYVSPDDSSACARAVELLLKDSERNTAMARAGYDYVKRFSTDNFFKQTAECYDSALRQFFNRQ